MSLRLLPSILVGLGLFLVAACVGGGEPLFPPIARPGPYNTLSDEDWRRVEEARADWDAGELRVARAALRFVAGDNPRNLDVAVLLQELELALLASGAELADLEQPLGGGATANGESPDALTRLRRLYRDRAENAPSPEGFVLAARLETDVPAARALLDRALELDPVCAWAEYGRAHLLFAADKFREADVALQRALEADPFLMPARRLRSRMLARSATAETAIRATRVWLDAAETSPFVGPVERAQAEFDLAILHAQEHELEEVEKLAAKLLTGGHIDPAPVYLVLAAARISDGDPKGALAAARSASRIAPDQALAHVQRALILEEWQVRPEKAYDAWLRALDAATGTALVPQEGDGSGDADRPDPAGIRDAQLWLLARTRLARMEESGIRGSDAP